MKGNNSQNDFIYEEGLKDVTKIIIDGDIADIHLVGVSSKSGIQYNGKKLGLGNPAVDIGYKGDQAWIKVRERALLRSINPFKLSRGRLVISVPFEFMELVQIKTGLGKIDVKYANPIKELILKSDLGIINVDSFTGACLHASTNVGTINLGKIDGSVHITSSVGRVNIADLSMKGKNIIKTKNSSIIVGVPNENLNEVGLNISTKIGRIISKNNRLAGENIYFAEAFPPGRKVINRYKGNKELTITSAVGNIRFY
ncbi:DUF4097 family beta strand repeat-containing protein [Paenibacillus senegalensis]|uniref:hypothetical protein n=1 Tax=Paenibacillus senegalensis TaxID=1465766 RepID=UPI0002884D8C|nr:hypothetical protein [Paenibacillus senegalensis]